MAKKSKAKLPKRVAGLKVPKPLRKGVAQFLNSQDGRTLAMEALAATAALAGGAHKVRNVKAPAGTIGAAQSMASAFSYALGEGVRSFTHALQQGKARADAQAAWPAAPESGEAKKKSPTTGETSSSAH